ncbi:Alpha/Beta hydrolase protein [Podospora appendiculata]|uniref:Alpha/Beta hydrolase protein n=1 Tax=Podospora appendiculata TaxID=314037 RepID=A0AAE1CA74_9PEZI|nr:Alpha/Beta hydrolase protein [Podospora appendiculata]
MSVQSKNYPGVSISYKQTSICETTPDVKGYSGYVNLPASASGATYNSSIFFWYFEARNDAANAPVVIYLPGGPGTTFLDGSSGFPCSVNADSNTTTLNKWSFNSNVNMLYIDQPVMTGYSYTNAQDGLVNMLTQEFTPVASTEDLKTNSTTFAATLSVQNPAETANTTTHVTHSMWRFAQAWFQEFPEYKTRNKEISLWSYSYSGFFGPATLAYFAKQNERIKNGTLIEDPQAKALSLGTLGVNNGCIDSLVQIPSYPEFAVNNTYGVKAISEETYTETKTALASCIELIKDCRAEGDKLDPLELGNNEEVNAKCVKANKLCFEGVQGAYGESGLSPFDIALPLPGVFPTEYAAAFYNQRWVQQALGVPVNLTYSSQVIPYNMFYATGDAWRRTVADLEYVLATGLNVALVYGDRDYRCNWIGAEAVSLAMNYPAAPTFRAAGYAPLAVNASYTGGLVRQHGGVSFARVFGAGHAVAAYQPETVFRIFDRAVASRDVATGLEVAGEGYTSRGAASAWTMPPGNGSVGGGWRCQG